MPVCARRIGCVVSGLLCCWGAPVAADALADGSLEHFLEQDHLTGSWWGARTRLEERGLEFEAYYSLDVLGNVSGGRRRDSSVLGDVDLLLTSELEPLVGWPGARIFLYGLGTHGDRPSRDAGDLQGIDNIEAVDTWKLFEAWFEQELLSGRLSFLAGLYDVNSEFDVIQAASLFVHSSHGTGADFGLSGRNGPSTFPTTSLATRLQIEPIDRVYARFVVADGVPGDPNEPHGTEVHFDDGDGVLVAGEVGLYRVRSSEMRGRTRRQTEEHTATPAGDGRFGKFAVGAWGYTGDFDDFLRVDASGDPRVRSGSYGVYALAEQHVLFEVDDPLQGLSVFVRVGLADPRTAPVDGYVGAGAVYRGPIEGRDDDRLGFGVAAAHLGSDYRKAQQRAGGSLPDWEVALELTYRLHLTPWLSIQPDIQIVIDPAGDTGLDDAVVVGSRFILSL